MKRGLKIAIPILVVVVIALALVVWRLWPHSIDKVVGVEPEAVTDMACTAILMGVEEDGTPYSEVYQMQALREDPQAMEEILTLLSGTTYTRGLGGGDTTQWVEILLVWGAEPQDGISLTFYSNGWMEAGGFSGYPKDRGLYDTLLGYIRTNGQSA